MRVSLVGPAVPPPLPICRPGHKIREVSCNAPDGKYLRLQAQPLLSENTACWIHKRVNMAVSQLLVPS